jgi:hypothetical protein
MGEAHRRRLAENKQQLPDADVVIADFACLDTLRGEPPDVIVIQIGERRDLTR